MSMPKSSKLYQFINYRMKVTIQDSRTLVGKFMAFDKHLNLVLCDCEEYRKIVPKGKKGVEKIQKRMLGFVLLRGENIVTMTVEAPPSLSDSRVKTLDKNSQLGSGLSKQGSRGTSIPQMPSLQPMMGLGPIPSFGTPTQKVMMPQGKFPTMPGSMPPMPGFLPPMPGFPIQKKDEKK
jgi:small nuclear ribonucleoprotein (snRNP)-like protein